MKRILIFVAIFALLVASIIAVRQSNEASEAKIEVQNVNVELDNNKKKIEILEKDKTDTEEEAQQHKEEAEKLRKENEELERQLQAKKERERQEEILAQKRGPIASASEEPKSAPKTVSVTGNKESWLRASGIPESEWWAVDYIVSRESSWNPNAVNASSGACGLGQQLPCGKWAGAWNDPVAALKAQYGYVKARYGGYPQAVSFWQANHWY